MKTELEPIYEIDAAASQPYLLTAPSIRVPVTHTNRALLRRLRAAELTAWEDADRHPRGRATPPWFRSCSCAA
jgi:hypothetical protein